MPALDGGDIEGARQRAQENVRALYGAVQQGYKIVVPGPTCGYMMRREYPHLLKEEAGKAIGNPDLEDRGRAEKIEGKVERKVGEIKKVFGK